jgi:hypothetical protein
MKTKLVKVFAVIMLLSPATLFAARSECTKAGTNNIKDGTVTSSQIKDGAIESADIADGAVDGRHIEELVTVTPFILSGGQSQDIFDSGDLKLQAKCFNFDGYDTAALVIQNVTDGAILNGQDETVNLTSATPESSREVQRAAALTGVAALDYATRLDVVGANGALLKSSMFIGVNLQNKLGCHFGGLVHYTPAS